MFKSPVYNIIPVPIDKIKPNTYNPNAVAPPETDYRAGSVIQR